MLNPFLIGKWDPEEMFQFKPGDKVHVPGRYDRLIVADISHGLVRANFESGYGSYTGDASEFTHGWRAEVSS